MSEKTLKSLFGKRIKSLRDELGLTQEKASEKAGSITEKRWSDIERGKYSVGLNTLFKIAQGLSVPIYELFLFEEEKPLKKENKIARVENQVNKLEKELAKLKKEVRALRRPPE